MDRPRRGREDRRRRARRRARGGALRRRADRGAGRRGGPLARRDRGLLPDQRAVARAGGHPGPLRAAVPGDRRHQVLRARRDQGRRRLPPAPRQPGRPGQLRPGGELPAARDRRDLAGQARRLREHHRADDLGGGKRCGGRAGAGRGGGQVGRPFRGADRGAARRVRRGTRRRAAPGPARALGLPRRPGGGAHRSRPTAGSRTSRSWSEWPGSSTPTAPSRAIRT